MRKALILALLLGAVASMPFAATADDVRTPGECAAEPAPGWGYQAGEGSGRGSFCVSDGNAANGAELYIGGDPTQPCGSIRAAGTVIIQSDDPDHEKTERPNRYCH